jgi:two-component system sensor histidine kinase AgrC
VINKRISFIVVIIIVVLSKLLGGFIETFLLLIVGFYLFGVDLKNRMLTFFVVSIYGSILIFILRNGLSTWTYLFILVLCLGLLLSSIFNIPIFQSVIIVLIGSLCLLISEVISFSLVSMIFGSLDVNISFFKLNPFLRALPSWIILVLIYLIFKKKEIQFVKKKHLGELHWINLVIPGIVGIVTLSVIVFYRTHYPYILHFIILILLIGSSFIISYLFKIVLAKSTQKVSGKLYEQYEEDVKHYSALVESQRHDFFHHLLAIQGMLVEKNYEACKNYVNNVLNEAAIIGEVLPIRSNATAGLLLAYKVLAEKKGVKIYIKILDDLSDIPCNTLEMNRILGNLIKNAIEEAEKNIKKEVMVVIQRKKKFVQIEISNYANLDHFARNIDKLFHRGFSTKDGKEHCGVGLSNVYEIVKKYNGTILPEIRDELVIFTVTIPVKRGEVMG